MPTASTTAQRQLLNEQRVTRLETQHVDLIQTLERVDAHLTILDSKITARPSWATTAYITFVTALCAGLVSYVLTVHH